MTAPVVTDCDAVLLCDDHYRTVTGLEPECQDYCSLALDHDGVCADRAWRSDPAARCERCGKRGRLTEVDPAEAYCHDARHDTPCPLPCDGCEADGCDPDAAGPLTCERCGARVHNLTARGECITCIAGAPEPSGTCATCGTAAVFRSEGGAPARWTHLDIVAAVVGAGSIAHAPAGMPDLTGETSAAPAGPKLRKHTVFQPCEHHAASYASETRYRRAELMGEGGIAGSPCLPGARCRMLPGTDLMDAGWIAAHPVYYVGDPL